MVAALIGAYLNSCGEVATLPFMNWIGLHIDFVDYEKLVNVWYFETLLLTSSVILHGLLKFLLTDHIPQ